MKCQVKNITIFEKAHSAEDTWADEAFMFLLDYEVQMPPFKAKSSLEITANAESDQEESADRGTRIL